MTKLSYLGKISTKIMVYFIVMIFCSMIDAFKGLELLEFNRMCTMR